MARVCARCLEPVAPVNLCVCPDDDDQGPDDSSDEAEAAA